MIPKPSLHSDEINRLRPVQPYSFLIRVAVFLALVALLAQLILTTQGLTKVLCQVLLAATFAHGSELVHQCIHRTGTGSATTDRMLGVLMSWPGAISFFYYRFFHLWHHKWNGSERDAESFGYAYRMMQSPRKLVRIAGLIRYLWMIDHMFATAHRMVLAGSGRLSIQLRTQTPQMKLHVAEAIESEYSWMLIVLATGTVFSFVFHTAVLVDLWLIPFIFWGPIHSLIELPEHWQTASRPNRDNFLNTRSICAGRLTEYLVNGNNWHVEHHEFSFLPMARLRELHEHLARQRRPFGYLENSYPQFYRRFMNFIWYGGKPESI